MILRAILPLSSALVITVVCGASYTVAAINNQVPMTWPIFFTWLAVLTLTNLGLVRWLWEHQHELSLRQQVMGVLWSGLSLWYWSLAPLYFMLTMQINQLQLAWTAFAFFWEVPIIGSLAFIGPALVLLRPLDRYWTHHHLTRDHHWLYHYTFWYPRIIAALVCIISVFGYTIGALQLRFFAHLPLILQIKNVANGAAISLFLGLAFFLIIDRLTSRIRGQLERQFRGVRWPIRSIRQRMGFVTSLVSVGSISLMTLIFFYLFQVTVERHLAHELNTDITTLQELWPAADDSQRTQFLNLLKKGEHGTVIVQSPPFVVPVPLSPGTVRHMNEQSADIIKDSHTELKLIAFFPLPESSSRVVSVVYPTDFYRLFNSTTAIYLISGSFLVMLITLSSILLSTHLTTHDLRQLTRAIARSTRDHSSPTPSLYTGDELQTLAHTLARAIRHMHAVEKMKSEFVSLASHQLRTPLTAINWHLELLAKQKTNANLTLSQQRAIRRLLQRSRQMAELVDDLLNVSRLDAGRLTVTPVPTDLVAFLTDTVTGLMPLAQQHQCQLMFHKPDVTPQPIPIDQSLLRQVINNLVTNAIIYSSDRPERRVWIELEDEEDEGYVISVADTGIGIPERDQERIFDKFYRAPNATKLQTEGTGLGLYLVKMIIEATGGQIWFESRPGQGTTFHIRIPALGMQPFREKPDVS